MRSVLPSPSKSPGMMLVNSRFQKPCWVMGTVAPVPGMQYHVGGVVSLYTQSGGEGKLLVLANPTGASSHVKLVAGKHEPSLPHSVTPRRRLPPTAPLLS